MKYVTACFYGSVCVLLLALAKAGQSLVPGFPSEALMGTLWFFLPGGAVVFGLLDRFLPWAKQSEFFRVFSLLYHPGIWLLAVTTFAGNAGIQSGKAAECLPMAYIAGWTLLAAGLIVLILIIKEKHS